MLNSFHSIFSVSEKCSDRETFPFNAGCAFHDYHCVLYIAVTQKDTTPTHIANSHSLDPATLLWSFSYKIQPFVLTLMWRRTSSLV